MVLVVLGRRLNDDGSMSMDLIKRCDKALEFFLREKPKKVLLSGGAPNKKADRTEADAMKEYLIEKGVPQDKIIVEDKSLTTFQNAKFSAPIIKELKPQKVFVCSSNMHLKRIYLNPLRFFQKHLRDIEVEGVF